MIQDAPRPPVTFKAFARILGERSPSYVHQLKEEGRLVLSVDGKRVLVDESLARIRDTASPAHVGVAARHAADRATQPGAGAPTPPNASPVDAVPPEGPEPDSTSSGFQYWRERSEKAKALANERENAIADGKLMDAAEVEAAVAAAATTLRSRLESLPDVLGPQLAAISDEAQARATLAEAIEHALEEASRQFLALAKQGGA
jgi:hypothetical protein